MEQRKISFEIVEHIGVLSEDGKGFQKEVNLIRWDGGEGKIDIRSWDKEHLHMTRGITLTPWESKMLYESLRSYFDMDGVAIKKLGEALELMNEAYEQNDLKRNLRNSGQARAYANLAREMGYEIDLRIYNAGGFDLTDGIVINGRFFCFLHKEKMTDVNRGEFLGQIIDIFEDFLEEKGVWFDNPEREESGTDNPAIIYGTDYGDLTGEIEQVLENWGMLAEV